MFEQTFLCHFDESDPSGLAFFGRLPEWSHRTIETFISESTIGWSGWFKHPEWAVPIRHLEADYTGPIAAGERVTSKLSVSEIGESSVRFTCEFFGQEGKSLAKVTTTHVFVDKRGFKKIRVPNEVQQLVQSLQV